MKHCLPKKPRISRLSISPTLEQLHYITHLVVYNLLDVVSAPLHVQKELDHLQKRNQISIGHSRIKILLRLKF